MAQSKNLPARTVSKTTPAKVGTKAVSKVIPKSLAKVAAKGAGKSILKKLGPIGLAASMAYSLYETANAKAAAMKKETDKNKKSTKPAVKKPVVKKPAAKKPALQPAIVNPTIKSTYRPNVVKSVIDRANAATPKTPAKATPKPAATKPAGKTVSQVWKEKTGMDWSEAKKLGVSDGSAKSNMALLAKLNSGAMTRADLGAKTEPITMATKKVETVKSVETPELATKRKGGMVNIKMQKGGTMTSQLKEGIKTAPGAKTIIKAVKSMPEYKAYKAVGKTAKSIDDSIEKRYPNYTGKGSMYAGAKQTAKTLLGYKKGGNTKKKK